MLLFLQTLSYGWLPRLIQGNWEKLYPGTLRVTCIARGNFSPVLSLPLSLPLWVAEIAVIVTTSHVREAAFTYNFLFNQLGENSQLSGRSIFLISFKGWSKANDDNFKALLGGNDLFLSAGGRLKFTNQVAASGSVIEKCGGQSVFLSFIRAQVWEFINLCLGLAVMSLFTPLIKQTSVWLKAGWPSLDTEINSDIREKISHLCLANLRNSLTCMWVSYSSPGQKNNVSDIEFAHFASLMFGELLSRCFRSWLYIIFLFLLQILLYPVHQSGWAWSCWSSKTTSKSQWLKPTEVCFILVLHVHHVQHGLRSQGPHYPEQGLANLFYKGPDGKYFRLRGPYELCYSYSTLPLQWAENHRQYIKGWAQMCSNNTLFIKPGSGLDLVCRL